MKAVVGFIQHLRIRGIVKLSILWKIGAGFIAVFIFLFFVSKTEAVTFTISNPTVTSDDIVDVDVSIADLISASCSSTGCYVQAEFRILDESKNYFGYTYNNSGEFVDYFSSPSSIDEIKSKLFNFVPMSGSWSGTLRAKNNFSDSNYSGPGQYTIRLRRFSGNSLTSTGDSNSLTINLTLALPTSTPTPVPTSTPTSAPTNAPTSTPTSAPTNTPTPTKTPTPTPTKIPTPTSKPTVSSAPENVSQNSVLGESTGNGLNIPPPENLISTAKKPDTIFQGISMILGIIFIVICVILTSRIIKKGELTQNEEE